MPWTSLEPQEDLGAFRSLGSSVRLRDLVSLAPFHPLHPPSIPGPLDLRKPWEPWEAFLSVGSSVRLGALFPLLLITSPHSPLLPAWDLPGASGSLGSLWQPWVFSQAQGPCFPCFPSTPLPLSLPGSLGPPWNLR